MKANEVCHVGRTSFHNELGTGDYQPEDGRFWLYTAKLCPFAHRTEIVRALLGVEDRVGLTIADPVQTEKGWNIDELRYESKTSGPSPIVGIGSLPGIYKMASPGFEGRSSVPVLLDTKTRTIVNNESAEIVRQFARVFEKDGGAELYPEDKRGEIDEVSAFLEEVLVGPIYRAGFAKDQETYKRNFEKVFFALDALEARLEEGGLYLMGEELTLADVHAFPHLSRFDAVYHNLYRLSQKFIRDYPQLANYLRRLARIPAFADTLDIEAVKRGYFLSWNQPTEGTFVPVGPAVDTRSGVKALPATRTKGDAPIGVETLRAAAPS